MPVGLGVSVDCSDEPVAVDVVGFAIFDSKLNVLRILNVGEKLDVDASCNQF